MYRHENEQPCTDKNCPYLKGTPSLPPLDWEQPHISIYDVAGGNKYGGGGRGCTCPVCGQTHPAASKRCRVKPQEALPVPGKTHNEPQLTGGRLSHAASEVFEIVMFISFESIRPTICKCKRDRVRYFLNGSEPAELSALRLELSYVFLRWPFADSSTREVPSPHMLSQCGFREVVSRELIEDSIVNLS